MQNSTYTQKMIISATIKLRKSTFTFVSSKVFKIKHRFYTGEKIFELFFIENSFARYFAKCHNLFIEIFSFVHYSSPSKWYIYTTGQIKDAQRWALCKKLTHGIHALTQEQSQKKSIPPFHIKTSSASNIVLNERKFTLNQNVCDKYVTQSVA